MPIKRYNGTAWEVVAGDGVAGAQGPAGADGSAPLTTKGDLLSRTSSAVARLGVGSNGTVLTADSAETTGLKWVTPATSASGLTFITKSTASSVSSHTISNCFTSTYANYRVIFNLTGVQNTATDLTLQLTVGGTATTSGYASQRLFATNTSVVADQSNQGTDEWNFHYVSNAYPASPFGKIEFGNPNVATDSSFTSEGYSRFSAGQYIFYNAGNLNNTTQYDGFKILSASGTFSGDFYVYGYQKA